MTGASHPVEICFGLRTGILAAPWTALLMKDTNREGHIFTVENGQENSLFNKSCKVTTKVVKAALAADGFSASLPAFGIVGFGSGEKLSELVQSLSGLHNCF